jgi:hypothetical protein
MAAVKESRPDAAEGGAHAGAGGRYLAAVVAAAFGVGAERMFSSRRDTTEVALARQVAIYLIHTRLRLNLKDAGASVGRDRTTARYACRAVEVHRDDPRFDSIVDWLEQAAAARAGEAR